MKTSFKKLTSVFLAVLMLISVFTVVGASAAETSAAPTGGYTVVLDASGVDTGYVDWRAWTWADGGTGRWVSAHGTTAADITYDDVDENVIFAYFQSGSPVDETWTGKIGQTADMRVDGSTFTVSSVGDGAVNGSWSGSPTPSGDTPGDDPSPGGDPYVPSSGNGSYTVVLDASGVDTGYVDWRAWTWPDGGTGYWVSAHGTTAADITYDNVEKNVIFAYFTAGSPIDETWTGKIGQTADMTVDGATFTVSSVGDGAVYGDWSGDPVGGDDPDPTDDPYYPTDPVTDPPIYTDPPTDPPVYTDPPTNPPTDAPTTPPTTPPTEPASVIPTDPAAPDEDTNLYVSAKSNVNVAGSKVKVNGDTVTVSYTITAAEALDDGQVTITYDASKLSLNPANNTAASLFPVVKDASYNLNAGVGEMVFNFSATNGKYDFSKGGVLINLVFTRRSAKTVGTALVYMHISDLSSKQTSYINNGEIKSASAVTVAQSVSESKPVVPDETEPVTSASNNITVNASSNISNEIQKIAVDKSTARITYNLTAPDLIAYGHGTVTFDSTKLALEAKYNTAASMFTALKTGVVYNLNAGTGTMMFDFTSADAATQSGTYDFRSGAAVISLVFTVKAGATGSTDVYLELKDLGSFSKEFVSDGKVVSDQAVANIVIAGETPTTSPTSEVTTPIETGVPPTNVPTTPSDVPTTPTDTPSTPTTPTGASEQPTDAPTVPTDAPTTPTVQPTSPTVAPTVAPTAPPKVPAPKLSVTSKKLTASKSFKLTVKNATGTVKFKSTKSKIAKVSSKGKVLALRKGSAVIKVTVGGKTLRCKVTVTNNPVLKYKGKVVSAKKTYTIKRKQVVKLNLYRKAGSVNNVYSSTKKSVARVAGTAKSAKTIKVKGLKKGTTVIKIKVNGSVLFKFKVKVK